MGEYTVVASAKRGVRGTLSDDTEPAEDLRSLDKELDNGSGRFFSLGAEEAGVSCLYGQLVGSSD
jgi:hypothetical protein